MSYPLLKNLNDYISVYGISSNEVFISSKRLPSALREAALKEVNKKGYNYKIDDTCILSYDSDGHLSLIITFNEMKANLLVTDNSGYVNYSFANFKYTKISSDILFKKAQILECINKRVEPAVMELSHKYLKEDISKIKNSRTEKDTDFFIKEYYKKKNILENVISDSIKFLYNTGDLKIDFENESSLNKELIVFEDVCKQYIKHINDSALLNQKQKDIIWFDQEVSDSFVERIYMGNYSGEENNSVLPFEARKDIISYLNPIFSNKACSAKYNDNQNIYYCYLCKTGENEYKIIMEPFNSKKDSKIACFKYEDKIDQKKFDEIACNYLEVSESGVFESDNMMRIDHTSLENYAGAMLYAVTLKEEIQTAKSLKEKANSLNFEDLNNKKIR